MYYEKAPVTRAVRERARPRSVEHVLAVLHSERFVDRSPAQVSATLLDEDTYLCPERTMYRLLAATHGGARERRDQLTHPAYREARTAGPSGVPVATARK
jgi:putative transposase